MRLFDRNTPGVEWSPGADQATAPLVPPEPAVAYPSGCTACGGELGIDGYCLTCGQKSRSLREHYELTPAAWLAGICDIGQTHPRNEDALACQAEDDRAVIVVCDGVTTSEGSDRASMTAARTACDLLWNSNPRGLGTPASRTAAVYTAIKQAVEAANQAVSETTDPGSLNSAATTMAVAVVDHQVVYCANLGDSRVYWLPDASEPYQVTRDHSLAQDGIDSGAGRAEAEASVFAHTITKWLGRDAVDLDPYLATVQLDGPGWLLVCSDGLWNYASEAAALAHLVSGFAAGGASAGQVAARLVAWANDQGGHDNVTVACARFDDRGPGRTAAVAPGPALATPPAMAPGPATDPATDPATSPTPSPTPSPAAGAVPEPPVRES